jgi:CRP-like cAMP-binding protein
MLELFSLTDLTGTLSYAIIALSYMMTRIFWLRVAAVIGLFLEIASFRLSNGDLKVGIGWDVIFIVINLFQIFLLVRERASLTLPEKDAPMLRQSFAGLDDAQIARLLKAADWRDAQPGEILTKQDHAVDSLFFLCSGRASVEVNGSFETYLEKGSFIGEIAYLTGNLATATVVIDEPSRVLAFSKQRMAKVTNTDSRIAGIIYELLGRDLAQKMRRSNTRRVLLQDESDVL